MPITAPKFSISDARSQEYEDIVSGTTTTELQESRSASRGLWGPTTWPLDTGLARQSHTCILMLDHRRLERPPVQREESISREKERIGNATWNEVIVIVHEHLSTTRHSNGKVHRKRLDLILPQFHSSTDLHGYTWFKDFPTNHRRELMNLNV